LVKSIRKGDFVELHEFINKLVSTETYDFNQRNNFDWFKESSLKDLYLGTTGPHKSPDPVECWILYNLAKNTKGNIFEVGSWKGRSSAFLASGIVDSGKSSNRHLYCLDWFKGDNTGGADPNKLEMEASLNKFGLTSLVTIFDEDMLKFDYASKISNIDLMFYDSDHRTEPTVKVLTEVHPMLNDNCILAMHDAGWGMTKRAIDSISDKFIHLKTIPVWEGFALLIKK
jgi:predicted O-methyltransferase YrrM